MKSMLSRFLLAAACATCAFGAGAQTFPSRPITIVVPFPAGNSSDIAMRLLGQELQPALGQPVIVENRAGAGGAIGAAYAAKRPADGYTLLMGSPGPMAIGPAMRKGLTYDPLKSFEPVAPVAFLPLVTVVSASSPIRDLPSLLKTARENPDGMNYASSGIGSTQHLAMAALGSKAGVKMTHVPFQGSGAGMTAIVGGQVQVMTDVLSAVSPMVRSGQMRPIAVMGTQRLEALPDVPTVMEQGLKDFDLQTWIMLYAPAGTPQDVLRRLNAEIAKALQTPRLKKAFAEQSMIAMPISYENLQPFMVKQVATWRSLVELSGAAAE